jgi:hypothetical protein
LKDPEFKFYGSYTIFVCVYTKKGMDWYKELLRESFSKDPMGRTRTADQLEKRVDSAAGGDMHYVRYMINVTVFSAAE